MAAGWLEALVDDWSFNFGGSLLLFEGGAHGTRISVRQLGQ